MTIAGPGPIAFRTARTRSISRGDVGSDLHLDRVEAGGDQFLRGRSAATGLIGAHREPAAHRRAGSGAAEQLIDRLPDSLPQMSQQAISRADLANQLSRRRRPSARRSTPSMSVGSRPSKRGSEHAIDQGLGPPDRLAAPARRDGRLAGPFDAASVENPHQHESRDTSCSPSAETIRRSGLAECGRGMFRSV